MFQLLFANCDMTLAEQKKTPAASSKKLGQLDGVLVVNKPKGPSSAQCIARIKRELGQKKIGHAGTLDPMARGVLLVLLGQATKLSGYLMDAGEKIYSGVARLGLSTDTWDAEGETVCEKPVDGIGENDVRDAMAALCGSYEQEVPPYSAAKHQGKPLYALARKGLETPVKKKFIEISQGEVEWVDPALFGFRVKCGSGTYIRSLAHSLGIRLGCGATLMELSREYSCPFGIDKAHHPDDLIADPDGLPGKVAGIADVLFDWPKIALNGDETGRVKNGNPVQCRSNAEADRHYLPGARALLLTPDGQPLALAMADDSSREWNVLRGLWNN